MTEKEQAYFNGFAINEGAYFYRRNFVIDEREIKKVFKTIKDNAHSHINIVEIIKEPVHLPDDRTALCSLKIFQDKVLPSFINDVSEQYQKNEILICYLLLIEIEDYIVLFSRHANGLSSFKNNHTPILGDILAGALVNEDTKFTQMRMGNMNFNQNALRNKSYESDDLKQAMPTQGVGRQILKTTRILNGEEAIALGLGTSRVSKIGSSKKTIEALSEWAEVIINGIQNPYDITHSFMSHFATPVRWKDYKDSLIPAYLLIDFHELSNHIQNGNLTLQYQPDNEDVPSIDPERFFTLVEKRLNGCMTLSEKVHQESYTCDRSFGLLDILIQKTGIRLKGSGLVDNFYLVDDQNMSTKIITYINSHKCFYVGFEDVQYIYQGNQLHKDSNILNSIESILSVFKGIPEMAHVHDEKGKPNPEDIDFAEDTVFGVVENLFQSEGASHIICDDMGYECADHIVLSDNKISFIHSKTKGKTSLSASSFQEVIGQALKNIGNIRYMDVEDKVNHWRGAHFHGSKIDVCRKGDLETFADEYHRILTAPNGIKEVCLAIDFISKKELKTAFESIRQGRTLSQKHAISQMIWLLSGFISSCKDADLQCRIFCRE